LFSLFRIIRSLISSLYELNACLWQGNIQWEGMFFTCAGKYGFIVRARKLLYYWAVQEFGVSMVSLAERLNISPAAVTQSVVRGERPANVKIDPIYIVDTQDNVDKTGSKDFRRNQKSRGLFASFFV